MAATAVRHSPTCAVHDAGLVEQIRLPDMVTLPDVYCDVMRIPRGKGRYIEPGLFDGEGRKIGGLTDAVSGARVVIEFAGVTFIWGVFKNRLRAGQRGDLIFHNCPGTAPITSFFNEWDTSTNLPLIGDALFELISSQRGRNIAKVSAVNHSNRDLLVAAGYIISAGVEMPPLT